MSDPRRRRHRPRDHRRLLAMRPRTSTIVLTVAFLAVFALYLLVRPTPASVAAPQPTVSSTPTPVPAPSTSSPVPSASPTRTPEPSRSATPPLSATPSGSATPDTSGLGTAPDHRRPLRPVRPGQRRRAACLNRRSPTASNARGQTWRCPAPVRRGRAAGASRDLSRLRLSGQCWISLIRSMMGWALLVSAAC